MRFEGGERLARGAPETDVSNDAAWIDDRRDAPPLVDAGENRETDRLLRPVAGFDFVPVVGRCGENDGAVGRKRLLEPGELQHVGVADTEGNDDPRAPELGECEDAARLPSDERCGGGEVIMLKRLRPASREVVVAANDLLSFLRTTRR